MVSVVCSMWVVGSGIVIGLDLLDIKLMLCHSHVMVGSSTVIGRVFYSICGCWDQI